MFYASISNTEYGNKEKNILNQTITSVMLAKRRMENAGFNDVPTSKDDMARLAAKRSIGRATLRRFEVTRGLLPETLQDVGSMGKVVWVGVQPPPALHNTLSVVVKRMARVGYTGNVDSDTRNFKNILYSKDAVSNDPAETNPTGSSEKIDGI